MKIIKIFNFILVVMISVLGFSLSSAQAAGTFQLLNFNNSVQAVVGQTYHQEIDFLYSGNSTPSISIIGNPLPKFVTVGPITYKGDGLDSVQVYIAPNEVAGDFPLTIELTDNYGAFLTQPFDFDVLSSSASVNVLTTSLPDGTTGVPYSATVNLSWVGSVPSVWISGLPKGLFNESGEGEYIQAQVSSSSIANNTTSGFVQLSGTPSQVGQFTVSVAGQQFTLNINPNTTSADNPYGITNINITPTYSDGGNETFDYGGQRYFIPYVGTSVDINQIATDWVRENLLGGTPAASVGVASNSTTSIASPAVSSSATTPTSSPTPAVSVPAITTPPSYAPITQNLQVGASGQNVINLQRFLESKGFLTLPVGTSEGYFGNLTKQALIAFQASIGLPTTGYCGPMTRSAINGS